MYMDLRDLWGYVGSGGMPWCAKKSKKDLGDLGELF